MRETKAVKSYRVTLRFQHPAWDEVDGVVFSVNATSKAEAIRIARRDAYNAGHTSGGGRMSFTAVEAESAPAGCHRCGWSKAECSCLSGSLL